MTDPAPDGDFIDKWRAHWPEWRIGSVFVEAKRRHIASAWFALLHEFTTAAWAGEDATPGLAKLAWWNEELLGWSKRAKRHPLAAALQPLAADWYGLAATLRSLQATREGGLVIDQGMSGLDHFAAALATIEVQLFGHRPLDAPVDVILDLPNRPQPSSSSIAARIVADLLAERALRHGDGNAATAMLSAAALHAQSGTRPRRLQSAYLHGRLRRLAATGRVEPASPWRTLGMSWHAARAADDDRQR